MQSLGIWGEVSAVLYAVSICIYWYRYRAPVTTACINTEIADRKNSKDGSRSNGGSDGFRNSRSTNNNSGFRRNNDRGKDKSKKYRFYCYVGYEVSEYGRMKASAVIQQQELQARDQSHNKKRDQSQGRHPIGTTAYRAKPAIVCYNCGKAGHISTNCTEPKENTVSNAFVGTGLYPMFLSMPASESLDDKSAILDNAGRHIDLPLYHVLSQVRKKREVFSLPLPTSADFSIPSVLCTLLQRLKLARICLQFGIPVPC